MRDLGCRTFHAFTVHSSNSPAREDIETGHTTSSGLKGKPESIVHAFVHEFVSTTQEAGVPKSKVNQAKPGNNSLQDKSHIRKYPWLVSHTSIYTIIALPSLVLSTTLVEYLLHSFVRLLLDFRDFVIHELLALRILVIGELAALRVLVTGELAALILLSDEERCDVVECIRPDLQLG